MRLTSVGQPSQSGWSMLALFYDYERSENFNVIRPPRTNFARACLSQTRPSFDFTVTPNSTGRLLNRRASAQLSAILSAAP